MLKKNLTPNDDESAELTINLEELSLSSEKEQVWFAAPDAPHKTPAIFNFWQRKKQSQLDHRLARSIDAALHADTALMHQMVSQDLETFQDRAMAVALSGTDGECEDPPEGLQEALEYACSVMSDLSESLQRASATAYMPHESDEEESGLFTKVTEEECQTLDESVENFECSTCLDLVPSSLNIQLPCEHASCVNCTKEAFARSCTDGSMFPPRCCRQVIPLTSIAGHMSFDEVAAFESSSVEYQTKDRTYCSNHSCGKFIMPNKITPGLNIAHCNTCGTRSCTICKAASHESSDCPSDPLLKQIKQLAEVQKWQTCPECHMIIERTSGCPQMR